MGFGITYYEQENVIMLDFVKKHFKRDDLPTRMVLEFIEAFPGRCIICSFHRYGVENGLTTEKLKGHDCIESKAITNTET
jgi:hypothetical protein